MKYIAMSVLTVVVVAGLAGIQGRAQLSVKTMPPSVVKTVPRAGDTAVDPSLREITVTFSKDMTKKTWSWCSSSPETFPEIDKTKIRYLGDKRTCVLPVNQQGRPQNWRRTILIVKQLSNCLSV